MSLFEAAVHSLRAQVEQLDDDLQAWVQRTFDLNDLAIHRSQIARLDTQLRGTLEATTSGKAVDLEVEPPFQGSVADLPKLRRDIGSVHLLWEFFRDKLAQRDTDTFREHLGSADDLAWACYEPFLKAATAAHPERFPFVKVKEPPLVFYTTDRVPFAQARSKVFHPQGLSSKDVATFAEVLQSLPVPVIGVPWAVANRMPDLVLVGHEAGHVIAEDLGLAKEAKIALSEVAYPNDPDVERQKVWVEWSDEIFADIIGCLATGKAFVVGLAGELAGDPDEISQAPIDKEDPGKYPTPLLRMAVCEAALDIIGIEPSADWSSEYPVIAGAAAEFENDVALVADALLNRSWEAIGDRQLTELLSWDAAREQSAQKVRTRMLQEVGVDEPFDVRVWVAAAMDAMRHDPEGYSDKDLDAAFARSIVGQRGVETRSSAGLRSAVDQPIGLRGGAASMPELIDPDGKLQEADHQAGLGIAAKLGLGD